MNTTPALEDVLEYYGAALKPARSQKIRCLVHDERDPSMSVDLDKNLWKCHSCGAGGDTWTLIELREGVGFEGARAFAAGNGFRAGGDDEGDEDVSRFGVAGRRLAGGKGSKRGGRKFFSAGRRWGPSSGA